jgi:RHS repeat-associated protein
MKLNFHLSQTPSWFLRICLATIMALAFANIPAQAQTTYIEWSGTIRSLQTGGLPYQPFVFERWNGVNPTTYVAGITDRFGRFNNIRWEDCSPGVGFLYRPIIFLSDGTLSSMNQVWSSGCGNYNDDADWYLLSGQNPQAGYRYNAGPTSCPISSVGQPVNVTNGNMWLQHADYAWPGVEKLNVTRTYNSTVQESGVFGFGWSSPFDRHLVTMNQALVQLDVASGRRVDFLSTGSGQYVAATPDFYGQLTKIGSDYQITWKDGQIWYFSQSGTLQWETDRNGNQTNYSYNANNQLIGVVDPFGHSLTITPNANGTISQINDSIGAVAVATYGYDPTGALLKTVTYSDGSMYKFDYDTTTAPGKTLLTTVKDALDNILENHVYDSTGRAITSEKHGAIEKYEFDYAGWTATAPFTLVKHKKNAIDPYIETKYYIDRRGRNVVVKTEGLCGCGGAGAETVTYEYDNRANVTKKTDALDHITTYAYDPSGNLTTQTDVFGTQKFTYNTFGEVLTYQDRVDSQSQNPAVYTQVNTWDTNGNLKTITDALGKVTTIEYPSTNNKGLPDSIKDARNNITKFKWFPNSNLLDEIEDPYGKKTKFTWDARARILTATNALNHTTTYDYHAATPADRQVDITYPNLDKITYKYNIRRLLESVTDERNKVTAYEFDPQYRLTKITDPLGHFKQFGYDLMSNMTSYTDPLGKVTNHAFDDFNRLKQIDYPAAEAGATPLTEKFEYDKTGRIKKYFDTANRLTEYAYDDVNRTNTITNPELEVTTLKYNQRFQTTEVKDALNQIYQFTNDPMGHVLSQTRAGATMTYEYNEVGARKKRVDYQGRETKYTYDNLNRLREIEYLPTNEVGTNPTPIANSKSTYVYDDISRLTSATNSTGTVSFTYDNRNRIKSTTDVFGHLLEYEYERTSGVNQQRLKFDGAMYAAYNFDDAERLSSLVNSADSSTISFGYDNEDKLTSRTYPNGVTTSYSYFDNDNLKRLTDSGTTGTLFDRQYTYNSANQIETITEPANTRTFGYDLADRLKTVTASNNQNESYTFDDVGNRTASHRASSYTYQQNQYNRLETAVTPSQTLKYGYDANGSMTTKAEGSNFWRYVWDYENRMGAASSRKQSVRYKYDALGRRVQRAVVGGKDENTKFIYDGQDVLADDNAGTLTKYQNGLGIDNKLRVQTGNDAKYFVADHLGSTNGLTDSTGSLTSQTAYDSFGNQTGTLATRYGFTGRERDDTTGLMYYRARFYDPNLGRFISEDPIGFGGGDLNLYGYVSNSPGSFTDPSGLCPFCHYGDPLTFWTNGADQLDDVFNTAQDFYGVDPPIGWNPINPTEPMRFFDTLRGSADMLRCGSGLGQAIYSEDENGYGLAAFGAMDVQRCSALFATLASPFAGAGGASATTEACEIGVQPRSFNPFKGKTAPEIDQMFRNKGYQPRGPDPMNGRGTYVNPKTGRGYHIDANHPLPKGPHVGVHRPRNLRDRIATRDFGL